MAKPRNFKEANQILQPGSHPGYEVCPLDIFSNGDYCLSCWRLSLRERLSALFFGKAWLYSLSGTTQPPTWVQIMRSAFERQEKGSE